MANAPLDHIGDYARTHAPAGSVPDAAGAAQETAARLPTREALDGAVMLCGRVVEDAGHGWAEEARRLSAFALLRLGVRVSGTSTDEDDWPWRDVQREVIAALSNLSVARETGARVAVARAVESLRRAHALCCEAPHV